MSTVLIVVSILAGLVGLLALSNATMGVGIMAGACLLAILARIAQAHEHHRELHPAKPFVPVPGPGSSPPDDEWTPPQPTPTTPLQKGALIGLMVLVVVAIVLKLIWDLS